MPGDSNPCTIGGNKQHFRQNPELCSILHEYQIRMNLSLEFRQYNRDWNKFSDRLAANDMEFFARNEYGDLFIGHL